MQITTITYLGGVLNLVNGFIHVVKGGDNLSQVIRCHIPHLLMFVKATVLTEVDYEPFRLHCQSQYDATDYASVHGCAIHTGQGS